jgi:glutamate/tyrosine decarboxylase-like PLP-dependent enzyme
MDGLREELHRTADRIADYRSGLATAPVYPAASLDELVAGFRRPLPDAGTPLPVVIDELVAAVEPGLVASAGPRYFGFVTGGSIDAALCADLLVTGWDQLAFNAVSSPASFAAEVAAGEWVKQLLGLPMSASVGFVTGGQAANTVGLAAARQHVLAEAGWDVGADGLFGAPPVSVFAGADRHATVDRALRLLGMGDRSLEQVPADRHGAIDVSALASALENRTEAVVAPIVCVQAGNVATGVFDDFRAVCDLAREHRAWVHVDGAFGLWAAASPATRSLAAGVERADSWACDAHKWLNVPYDSGLAVCAHPAAHVAAMRYTAAYLTGQDQRLNVAGADLTPESSRRSRGVALWAAIRMLGRDGVADLVDRCCRLARRFAERLSAAEGLEVVNDVVLNQVLVSFGDDALTDRVVTRVQSEGICWMGATTWQGERVMRISDSNWATTEADVDRSVDAILRALGAEAS